MRITQILAIAALFCVATAAGAVTLAFKDKAGDVRQYSSTTKITGTAQTALGAMPITMDMTMSSNEKVTAVKLNVADVTYSVTGGSTTVKVGALPGMDPIAPITQPVPAFSLNFTRTPGGKVGKVTLAGGGLQLLGGPLDALNNQLLNPSQGTTFPDKDLKEGDKWEIPMSLNLNGAPVTITAKYTLVGTETRAQKTYQKITCDLEMSVPKLAIPVAAAGVQVNMAMTMKGTSTELFDAEAGELFSSAMKADVTMTTTVPGVEEANSTTTMSIDGITNKI
ncbi:MAG: hypothetical protein WCJ56_11245 [bacterium]